LQLAAVRKMDRLFLYTNDYDFIPLCRTLKALGINVNLLRLVANGVNTELVRHVDGFNALDEQSIEQSFEKSQEAAPSSS